MELLKNLFPQDNFTLVAVILGLPLLGAFFNGIFGKRLGKEAVRLMALTAIGGSLLASLVAFAMLVIGGRAPEQEAVYQFRFTAWHWFDASAGGGIGTAPLDIAFTVDRLSSAMMLIITGVGFLIHVYASAYMW